MRSSGERSAVCLTTSFAVSAMDSQLRKYDALEALKEATKNLRYENARTQARLEPDFLFGHVHIMAMEWCLKFDIDRAYRESQCRTVWH